MDKTLYVSLMSAACLLFPVTSGFSATPGSTTDSAAASGGNTTMTSTPTVPQKEAISAASPSPKPAYLQYTYYGDRYRDPFIPLTGEFNKDQNMDRPPQISTLLLKGIVQDQKGRMALLASGASSYILRGGRLYDGRNHLMKGISGVIKTNSVVLLGSDRTVRELRVNPTL